MMNTSFLARNIKYLRNQKNWSQQDLADRLNRVHGTISKWETEKEVPPIETLIELSKLFEVSIDYLVGNHYEQEHYVKEFNQLYQINQADEKLMQIVDYLKQHPNFKDILHKYTNMSITDRKVMEDMMGIIYVNK
ncbi:helix-turn-helix transcriptional regulator [Sutcliffiella horikoshii]|uniref:Helix-turn-helix transcriptional regulator n=1 Tax=Sutcliffiella horikoshii TaxID=79883 RepID=A0A5D4T2B9_9BACI|nr:helix-turn-helix transcriptional regulator [Sutcliffiella horikoshii]TYS69830.1 helix-turn-helix transcriptional regulator [Sutcliffiella horikoshii]